MNLRPSGYEPYFSENLLLTRIIPTCLYIAVLYVFLLNTKSRFIISHHSEFAKSATYMLHMKTCSNLQVGDRDLLVEANQRDKYETDTAFGDCA